MARTSRNQPKADTGRLKVLLYDLETSPNLAHVWGKYEQNVLGDFVKERQIISFAWKWLGSSEIHCLALPMLKTYKRNPEDNTELIRRLHELMNEADIVIGHNVDQFDDKMANVGFVLSNLGPASPHKSVDTLKVARKYFRFNSNKLDDLGKFLKLGEKTKHMGFDLWVRCMHGDKKAWALMVKYNKNDITLLEKVYLRLRPWMTNHPNMNCKDEHVGCPTCRGTNMMKRGWAMAKGAKRQRRYQCRDCGSWATVTLKKKKPEGIQYR